MTDRLRIKVRETVDRYQFRYQVRNVTKRIIPTDYAELFQKFGFNIVSCPRLFSSARSVEIINMSNYTCIKALLVLNKEVELNGQTRTTCLAQSSFSVFATSHPAAKCYVESLENKNGRYYLKTNEKNIAQDVFLYYRCLN